MRYFLFFLSLGRGCVVSDSFFCVVFLCLACQCFTHPIPVPPQTIDATARRAVTADRASRAPTARSPRPAPPAFPTGIPMGLTARPTRMAKAGETTSGMWRTQAMQGQAPGTATFKPLPGAPETRTGLGLGLTLVTLNLKRSTPRVASPVPIEAMTVAMTTLPRSRRPRRPHRPRLKDARTAKRRLMSRPWVLAAATAALAPIGCHSEPTKGRAKRGRATPAQLQKPRRRMPWRKTEQQPRLLLPPRGPPPRTRHLRATPRCSKCAAPLCTIRFRTSWSAGFRRVFKRIVWPSFSIASAAAQPTTVRFSLAVVMLMMRWVTAMVVCLTPLPTLLHLAPPAPPFSCHVAHRGRKLLGDV